ncbi:hypothetical protein [Serratia quinivorans]|uniref:hypothetical protein n=1 Tax=Serratia quinivorans TaxID=137545 RepID=UPI002E7A9422|nr:hypothetical protein [Serratia quinivorans]
MSVPGAHRVQALTAGTASGGSTPYACVIDRCAFARHGLATLVAERFPGEVLTLDCEVTHLQLPLITRVRPVSVLVYRLPALLTPLMTGLSFLQRFLARHAREDGQMSARVVLLTDLAPHWLYDTLSALLCQEAALLSVSVLPSRCSLPQLRAALAGTLPDALMRHHVMNVPAAWRVSGLSAREVTVLRDFLVYDIDLAAQARLSGRSVKTLYSLRLSAMRKLGVRTLQGLLRWRARVGSREVRI